ncbi:hypothetical protein FBY37_6910 [Streptomyces sp. SLBN-134]|nr:hypothetical protein FBY37_6910 [Streptomyces sp. SLBN-134]
MPASAPHASASCSTLWADGFGPLLCAPRPGAVAAWRLLRSPTSSCRRGGRAGSRRMTQPSISGHDQHFSPGAPRCCRRVPPRRRVPAEEPGPATYRALPPRSGARPARESPPGLPESVRRAARAGGEGGRLGVVVADAVKLVRDKEPHGLAGDMLRVEELEAALPSMTRWRAAARRSVDWPPSRRTSGRHCPATTARWRRRTHCCSSTIPRGVHSPARGRGVVGVRVQGGRDLQDLYEMGDQRTTSPFRSRRPDQLGGVQFGGLLLLEDEPCGPGRMAVASARTTASGLSSRLVPSSSWPACTGGPST